MTTFKMRMLAILSLIAILVPSSAVAQERLTSLFRSTSPSDRNPFPRAYTVFAKAHLVSCESKAKMDPQAW